VPATNIPLPSTGRTARCDSWFCLSCLNIYRDWRNNHKSPRRVGCWQPYHIKLGLLKCSCFFLSAAVRTGSSRMVGDVTHYMIYIQSSSLNNTLSTAGQLCSTRRYHASCTDCAYRFISVRPSVVHLADRCRLHSRYFSCSDAALALLAAMSTLAAAAPLTLLRSAAARASDDSASALPPPALCPRVSSVSATNALSSRAIGVRCAIMLALTVARDVTDG